MLTFDEPSHCYRWNDVIVPSVTQVLSTLTDLSHIPPATLERARQQGVDQHRMVELEISGELDEKSLPEWLRPRLAGFRRFVSDTGFSALASEHRMYHPLYCYAGTVDMVGLFRDGDARLIDLKRSLLGGKVIGYQTAAYTMAWEVESEMLIRERYALVLGDGTYKLEPYRDPQDASHFLAALAKYTNGAER